MESYLLIILIVGLTSGLGWLLIRNWYVQRVVSAQSQIRHYDGRVVSLRTPKVLIGNLADVYQADNRLNAYHGFHEQFGEIVQIFWLWRQQISITNFSMIQHILIGHQKNYRKFPPNQIIQRLYGSSVLTSHGQRWSQQRTLMQEIFVPKRVKEFHPIFRTCSEELAVQWHRQLQAMDGILQRDIYPDLMALFLDIMSQATLGTQFNALQGEMKEVLASIHLILKKSTHPLYQFIGWWQHLPLPQNRELENAFTTVEQFLNDLIQQRRMALQQNISNSDNLLDLLLQSTEWIEGDIPPLTEKEVRDNLLAIILNGYETVATSVALTLDLLARHPEHQHQVQGEIDQLLSGSDCSEIDLSRMPYLRAVIVESLRLCPPMAGIQRVSMQSDTLEGWSIPADQAVGIPLLPVHLNSDHYGDQPAQFFPQRYREAAQSTVEKRRRGCPLQSFLGQNLHPHELPLTFGDGARRCLGEVFALHEMTIALAVLLHQFSFTVQPGEQAEMELGKFGLFISMLPKAGVTLMIKSR
jgi:cytochrome P450